MSHERSHRRLVIGAFASFLVALLVADFMVTNAFTTTSRERQIAACNRGNDIRDAMNEQRNALIDSKTVLLGLVDAVSDYTKNDQIKTQFDLQRGRLENIRFKRIERVQCEKVIRNQ